MYALLFLVVGFNLYSERNCCYHSQLSSWEPLSSSAHRATMEDSKRRDKLICSHNGKYFEVYNRDLGWLPACLRGLTAFDVLGNKHGGPTASISFWIWHGEDSCLGSEVKYILVGSVLGNSSYASLSLGTSGVLVNSAKLKESATERQVYLQKSMWAHKCDLNIVGLFASSGQHRSTKSSEE